MDAVEIQIKVVDYSLSPDEVQRRADSIIELTLWSCVSDALSAIRSFMPIGAEGYLFASLTGEVQSSPHLQGRVSTPAPYGIYVEQGTGPRTTMPPIGPLEQWAMRKLGLSGSAATSAAWGIAINIMRHGTKAQKMFKKGRALVLPAVRARIANANQLIRHMIGQGKR